MITRWIELVCDKCFAGTGDVVPSGDSKETRKDARAQGWTRRDGKDFCPECSSKDGKRP